MSTEASKEQTVNNGETLTVTVKEPAKGVQHQFHILTKFFKDNPTLTPDLVEKEELYTLSDKYRIATYCHNEKGPAWTISKLDAKGDVGQIVHEEYWLNCARVTDKEQIKKLQHDNKFSDRARELLNS